MKREPTVQQEITDRATQRTKLEAFLRAHPSTIYSQETLAEACGADVGAIRTRITELKRAGMYLRWESGSYRDWEGIVHRGKKRWSYVPRPAEPLGRDAGDSVGQSDLFS